MNLRFACASLATLAAVGCAQKAEDFSSCPASAPAQEVMDRFMTAFNAKDMAALEATFHFPHIRISVYPLKVLTAPGQQEDVFGILAGEGWSPQRLDQPDHHPVRSQQGAHAGDLCALSRPTDRNMRVTMVSTL